MDESGIHDGSPVVTVAAYIGRPRDWLKWEKRWRAAKRPIGVFHSADAQHLRGEFEDWSASARDNLVRRILLVIVDAGFPGMVIGVHMDEYRRVMTGREDLAGAFGTVYGACFQWLIQTLLLLQARTGNREKITFVHERNDYEQEATQSFDYVRHYTNPQQTQLALMFGEKARHLPLQTADILAYEGNRRLRDPTRPERRPWTVLNPDRRIFHAHYGRDNMAELVRRLELLRDGRADEIGHGLEWAKFFLDAHLATQRK
jgi:hypothetical protein